MQPDLSVVIVAYNCRDALADCLASLESEPCDLSLETTVVDNASRDGTAEMVRRRFERVRLIANDANRGFAAANNQGIDPASGRHILLLNPDTVVHGGAPAAKVTHIGGVSAATATANLFFCRSLFRYVRKHNGWLKGFGMEFILRFGMFLREGLRLIGSLLAAGPLAMVGQTRRARRRVTRARSAARFAFCDGWRTFLKA